VQPALTDRIGAALESAGNRRSGLPEAFTYGELAAIAYGLGELKPTRSQLSAVRRSVVGLVAEGRAERDAERRLGERGSVEVRRSMTEADHELRNAALRPIRERIEAQAKATPYAIDTGSAGMVEVMVEPVLRITEDGVELREVRP